MQTLALEREAGDLRTHSRLLVGDRQGYLDHSVHRLTSEGGGEVCQQMVGVCRLEELHGGGVHHACLEEAHDQPNLVFSVEPLAPNGLCPLCQFATQSGNIAQIEFAARNRRLVAAVAVSSLRGGESGLGLHSFTHITEDEDRSCNLASLDDGNDQDGNGDHETPSRHDHCVLI